MNEALAASGLRERLRVGPVDGVLGGARCNALICADNLQVLRGLGPALAGTVRCVYMDPPYNSGRTFAEYTDRFTGHAWEEFMRPRIEALHPLLASDGALFVQIDDTELGRLQRILDDVFGAHQRVSTITVVRSAATGHKAQNRGPVNVTDFLLVYAKDRSRFRPKPLFRKRRTYDGAYNLFVEGRCGPPQGWRFIPLAKKVAESIGHPTSQSARRAIGMARFKWEIERFAMDNAGQVARFAQPRFEAVSKEAQRCIVLSRQEPDRVFRLKREGHADLLLYRGDRILFLERKVATHDGVPSLVEPLTNVWDDVPFQGIAREGGVVFPRNKKPERLLQRVLELATEPGDLVLDPFLGSGSTAAVAHKMGRRWIGIENGEHCEALCLPRLSRVVRGEDRGGITRSIGWEGGGGFQFFAPCG